MTFTFNDICQQGAFPNAYLFHICGMPWAATNSPELKAILDAGDSNADALRKKIFGFAFDPIDTSWDEVQVLEILSHDLGQQSIGYDATKRLNVSGWSVRLSSNPDGFVWTNGSDFEQWGVLGLDWQPVPTVQGAVNAWLGVDFAPSASINLGTLQFALNKGGSLYNWLIDNWNGSSYDESLYMYMSSCCMKPYAAPVDNGDGSISVSVVNSQFNAPNEVVRAVVDQQNILITNYPQAIEGLTANLYAVEVDNDGNLLSGTTPFFMRSGKVKTNATVGENGGWTINVGGFTDQLKIKAERTRFHGSLRGYEFNQTSSGFDGIEAVATGHVVVREYTASGYRTSWSYVGTGFESYSTREEIIEAIVTSLNANTSLQARYVSKGDDITWEEDGSGAVDIAIWGPAAFATGLGYVRSAVIEDFLMTLTDPINSNPAAPYPLNVDSYVNLPQYVYVSAYSQNVVVETGRGSAALLLRNDAETEAEFIDRAVDNWNSGVFRNRAVFDYYRQFDLSQASTAADLNNAQFALENQTSRPVPNTDGTGFELTIYRNAESEVDLSSGDVIQFGDWGTDFAPLGIYGTVNTYSSNEATFTGNSIVAFPWSMYSCSNFFTLLRTDKAYYDSVQRALDVGTTMTVADVLAYDKGDLFAVTEVSSARTSNPTNIIKQLIGDTSADGGVAESLVQTSIKNIVQRGDSANFVPFIDWTTLDELLDQNKIAGSEFTFNSESSDIDWLGMLNNLCLTHGIQQVWEYTEVYRCWWLTFKLFAEGNESTAQLGGRTITADDIAQNRAPAISGGDWLYNRISGSYKNVNGNDVEFYYKLRDSRTGHMTKDRTLTVKDAYTLLPVEDGPAQDEIIRRFATMLQMFSAVRYKQQLNMNMVKTARIGVGRWASISWEPLLNRLIGRRGDDKIIGEINSMAIDLTNGGVLVQVITDTTRKLAISSSLNSVTLAKNGNVVTFSGLSKDPTANDYAPTDGGLTDLATFGCFDYYDGEVQDRNCSCTGYRVTVMERNPTDEKLYFDPAYTYASQNVWRGTMAVVPLSDVTGTGAAAVNITLDGNGTAFDITKDYVVTFADRADSGLQPCQTDYFGWLGDENDRVTLSDSSKESAILVKA